MVKCQGSNREMRGQFGITLRNYLPVVLRIFLGVLFVYASLNKVADPKKFAMVIYNYQILPSSLVYLTAVILPWVELLVGFSLLTGVFLSGGSLLAFLSMVIFFLALGFNLVRGINVDCGCFEMGLEQVTREKMIWYLVRDGFLIVISGFVFWSVVFGKVKRS